MPLSTYVTQENVRFNGTLQNAVVIDDTNDVRTLVLTDNLSVADQDVLTKFLDTYLDGVAGPLAGPVAGALSLGFSGAATSAPTGLSNATATAAKAQISFKTPVTGATASGLRTSTGTAAYQAVDFGAAKAGGDPTGLSNGVTATAGRQDVTKTGVVSGTATNFAAGSIATAGRQDITKAGLTGAGATGLANDTTEYTITVTINGTPRAVSIVGSAAQTYTTLVSEINNDLGVNGTAAIVGAAIRITSPTTGASSTVSIADGGGTGTGLVAAITGAIAGAVAGTNAVAPTTYTATITVDGVAKLISIAGNLAATVGALVTEINTDLGASATATLITNAIRVTSATTGATSTVSIVDGGSGGTGIFATLTGTAIIAAVPGVAGSAATTYTATVNVDGVPKAISVLGSAAQTFTTLIAEINADLGASATAALNGGDIRITSAKTGEYSKVVITAGTLFPAVTGYVAVLPAVVGTGVASSYGALVIVDGVTKRVSFVGSAGATLADVVNEINADLGASATAAITSNQLVITSATTGANSSVAIQDTGMLFGSLAGYNGTSFTLSTAPRTYTATITVDGVAKPVSVVGSAAQTIATIVTAVTTAVGAAGTVSYANGELKVESATTGVASVVTFQDGDLFKSITGFAGVVNAYKGIASLLDAFNAPLQVNSSDSLADRFNVTVVGVRPAVGPVPGRTNLPLKPPFIYFGGSPADWRYLKDDSLV